MPTNLEVVGELDRLFHLLKELELGEVGDSLQKTLESSRNLIRMGYVPYIIKRRAGRVVCATQKGKAIAAFPVEEEDDSPVVGDLAEARIDEEGRFRLRGDVDLRTEGCDGAPLPTNNPPCKPPEPLEELGILPEPEVDLGDDLTAERAYDENVRAPQEKEWVKS